MSEPAQAIEIWEIGRLRPSDKNAKNHPEDQVEALAKAIKTFGWSAPIVLDADGEIIAGHGRRLAAIKLGLEKVPVICRRDLSKAEADALRLADNRVVSTEYDMGALQNELARLMAETDIDITSLGFTDQELEFTSADLGAMTGDFFVEDISQAVETQKNENARKSEEVDDTSAPAADAFGFKRVTIAQSRKIRSSMSAIEQQTGMTGVDALIEFFDNHL